MNVIPITLYIFFSVCSFGILANSKTCGYNSCDSGKPDVLNVHLIPHTHDDVGWLKTVDQYYYGYRDDIQSAGVQYILDTVISALWENPKRRFSYVEMAYFYRWWKEQNSDTKLRVRKLVDEGRLQFLLGGWSMNDEAATHYTAIIDQMALGLDFLNKTFGECGRPLVSWQIDPFGHSIEQANLFANMGFDALFFMRLDYRDKQQRIDEKRMEFLQSGSFYNSKNPSQLFTNILFDSYCTPPGFCFDDKCSDDPIMDDPSLNDYNVEKRVNDFANYVLKQSKTYQTNHILVPMGCDFQFQNSFHNFVNIDKLIFHVNRLRKDINVMYSTPACYTLAVNKANKPFTTKKYDFFPYASGANSYWTGYFTSRAALKGFVRYSNNVFQICKQLHVISQQNKIQLNYDVNFMAMKMGVLQHHDAVSGTEKQHVAFDYEQRLDSGVKRCENVINLSLSKLISKETVDYNFDLCSLHNISYCSVSDKMPYNKSLNILVYNPLLQASSHWIHIPVEIQPKDTYKITKYDGSAVDFQIRPITERTKNIPERPKSSAANFDLVFKSIVPPVGYSSFTIQRVKSASGKVKEQSIVKDISYQDNVIVENKYLKLTYSKGFLKSISNVKSGASMNVTIDLRYYLSYQDSGQKSGAYIFRPTTNESLPMNQKPKLIMVKGLLVTEMHQIFSDWGTLITRLYNDNDKVEVEWTVGPIPVADSRGKEVVLHYQTDLDNENNFLTDSNARQTIARRVNSRFDYKFNQTEPVSGNFYPINSHVLIVDLTNFKQKTMIVHVDRAEGVGSYRNGLLEVMVHRRTLYDDNFGVGEPLNETGADGKGLIVRGKHWLAFDNLEELLKDIRLTNLKLFNKPLVLFSRNFMQSKIGDYSAILSDLPEGINLLTLENHYDLKEEIDYQIIRLENVRDISGGDYVVDLTKIFKHITITNIEELNLSANQFFKDVKRLQWKTTVNEDVRFLPRAASNVILSPGQIRTFKVNCRPV